MVSRAARSHQNSSYVLTSVGVTDQADVDDCSKSFRPTGSPMTIPLRLASAGNAAAHPGRDFSLWLQVNSRQAIRNGAFMPKLDEDLIYICFDDQQAVNAWLRNCWTTWFPGYPYLGE